MRGMKHEYHEGPKAGENFKKLATAVFRAPKVGNPKRERKAEKKGDGQSDREKHSSKQA